MGWFDDQSDVFGGSGIYEQGGVTGRPAAAPPVYADPPPTSPAQAVQQTAQQAGMAAPSSPANVGHDGTYNGMSREQWRDAWMGLGSLTPQAADQWLASHGATQVNANNGTWTTPFGETLDLQIGRSGALANGGMIRAGWGGGGGGADTPTIPAGAVGGTLGGMNPVSIAQGAGGGSGYAHYGTQPFDKFVAPDPAQLDTDPAYQFRVKEGQRARLNAASALGNIRTGATAKALDDYGQAAASQEYDNIFNRALAGYNANTNAALGYGNLDLGYTQAGNQYALGLGNLALGNKQADQSYDLGLRNNQLGYYSAGNQYALGMGQLGLGWANYGLNAQGQNFNQQYALTNLGLSAANGAGAYGANYGNQAGGYITGAGNAAAASRVAQGNAWGGTLGNIGQGAMTYGWANR